MSRAVSASWVVSMSLLLGGCFLLDDRHRRAAPEEPIDEPELRIGVESARATLEVWQGFDDSGASDLSVRFSAENDSLEAIEIVGVSDVELSNPSAGLTSAVIVWEQEAVVVPPSIAAEGAFRGAVRSNALGVCDGLSGLPSPPEEGTLRLAATFHTADGDVRIESVPVRVDACVYTE